VTYPDSTVLCGNNANPAVIRNAVTLGVACKSENATITSMYNDHLLFECGEASDDFENIVDSSVIEGVRYSCGSLATFASSSVPTEQVVSNVSITTDDLWLSKEFSDCFTLSRSNTVPSVPMQVPTTNTAPIEAPTTNSAPMQAPPINSAPIQGLTTTRAPISSVPIHAPTAPDILAQNAPVTAPNNSTTIKLIGSVVGGLVGGMMVMAFSCLAYTRRRQRNDTERDVPKPVSEINLSTDVVHSNISVIPSVSDTPLTDSYRTNHTSNNVPSLAAAPIRVFEGNGHQVSYKDQCRNFAKSSSSPRRDGPPPLARLPGTDGMVEQDESIIPLAVAVAVAPPHDSDRPDPSELRSV
jgi:hypothetical protein